MTIIMILMNTTGPGLKTNIDRAFPAPEGAKRTPPLRSHTNNAAWSRGHEPAAVVFLLKIPEYLVENLNKS